MNEGVYKNDSSPKILQGPKEQENTPQNPLNLGEGNGTPVAIIVENFYKDADEVRKFALSQEFGSTGNYPGLFNILPLMIGLGCIQMVIIIGLHSFT